MRLPMRLMHCGTIATAVFTVNVARAQSQLPSIPLVIVEAMDFDGGMLGKSRYFDGRVPTDWPPILIPAGARVIGGGLTGDPATIAISTAVFAMPGLPDPKAAIATMLIRAGYARFDSGPVSHGGGFQSTVEPEKTADKYCKESSLVSVRLGDTIAQSARIIILQMINGEFARQNCSPRRDTRFAEPPVTLPPLTPPSGVMAVGGGGSGWSGSTGTFSLTLRTTLRADSIVAHYTRQLVASGWKAEGRIAFTDGAALQRFSFLQGKDKWVAALVILEAADRRDVQLQYSRIEP